VWPSDAALLLVNSWQTQVGQNGALWSARVKVNLAVLKHINAGLNGKKVDKEYSWQYQYIWQQIHTSAPSRIT
jgi:hypothetical protein